MKGQTPTRPDDGLTTRERRNRPMLLVHTGDGKGKTSAAMGMALRAWAQGWPVGIYQFVKSATWVTGSTARSPPWARPRATSPSSGWALAAPGCGRRTVVR